MNLFYYPIVVLKIKQLVYLDCEFATYFKFCHIIHLLYLVVLLFSGWIFQFHSNCLLFLFCCLILSDKVSIYKFVPLNLWLRMFSIVHSLTSHWSFEVLHIFYEFPSINYPFLLWTSSNHLKFFLSLKSFILILFSYHLFFQFSVMQFQSNFDNSINFHRFRYSFHSALHSVFLSLHSSFQFLLQIFSFLNKYPNVAVLNNFLFWKVSPNSNVHLSFSSTHTPMFLFSFSDLLQFSSDSPSFSDRSLSLWELILRYCSTSHYVKEVDLCWMNLFFFHLFDEL